MVGAAWGENTCGAPVNKVDRRPSEQKPVEGTYFCQVRFL